MYLSSRKYPRIALGFIALILISSFFATQDVFSLRYWKSWQSDFSPLPAWKDKKGFMEDALQTVHEKFYNDAWDVTPIREMCAKSYHGHMDGIQTIIQCWDGQGGVGNIRQQVLSCMRWAIDGGFGMIVPRFSVRDEHNLAVMEGPDRAGINYYFEDWPEFTRFKIPYNFEYRVKRACPQMQIYRSIEQLKEIGPVHVTDTLSPRDLPEEDGHFPYSIAKYAEEKKAPNGTITVIPFGMTMAIYPVCRDGAAIADNFGGMLYFRRDTVKLAAAALWEMSGRFNVPINPDPLVEISRSAYLGVHLRTSMDAPDHWPKYREQADYYLNIAQTKKFAVIYIASGNETETSRFAAEAAALNPPIAVVTKSDLLSGDDRTAMEAMTWDQQAMIDYQILLKSSYFGGMTESSFSWNIAAKRRTKSKKGTCGKQNKLLLPRNTVFKDEYSVVLGSHSSDWEFAMWP